jgi:MoaA/NifB/PqqE/SkfB family radical SAM enzyme
MGQVDEARSIGLTSVKFLGPGELFQNPDLFKILDAFEERQLPIGIFTKGAELGSDELAARAQGHNGIRNGLFGTGASKRLVERIAEYETVRILLGFNSFFPQRQDALVGSTGVKENYRQNEYGRFSSRGVKNYTEKRDRALELLVKYGFNDPARDQRLTLVATPVLKNQVDEVPAMYEWAARRNMPIIIAPSMESGPKAMQLMQIQTGQKREHDWVKDLYVSIYSRAIETGITTMSQLRERGISSYMGLEACNQVSNGLFMRLNGQVKICPGSSYEPHIFGNIHDTPLIKLWLASSSYQRGRVKNDWCQAKVTGLPERLQGEVMDELERKYERQR